MSANLVCTIRAKVAKALREDFTQNGYMRQNGEDPIPVRTYNIIDAAIDAAVKECKEEAV